MLKITWPTLFFVPTQFFCSTKEKGSNSDMSGRTVFKINGWKQVFFIYFFIVYLQPIKWVVFAWRYFRHLFFYLAYLCNYMYGWYIFFFCREIVHHVYVYGILHKRQSPLELPPPYTHIHTYLHTQTLPIWGRQNFTVPTFDLASCSVLLAASVGVQVIWAVFD